MGTKNSHCSFCGQPFSDDEAWPRRCAGCNKTTFRNPIPVAVVIVPIGDGVLMVRRGVAPCIGLLALPGGYVDCGETWQQAGAREVWEETGLRIDPAGIELFDARTGLPGDSLADGTVVRGEGTVLVFGVSRALASEALTPFQPTSETSERVIIAAPIETAFPLHTRVLTKYFRQRAAHEARPL